jgi:hypothetical protein
VLLYNYYDVSINFSLFVYLIIVAYYYIFLNKNIYDPDVIEPKGIIVEDNDIIPRASGVST